MAQVTVQSGGYVTIPGSGTLNVTLQNQIAAAILAAATASGGSLFTATVPASSGPSVPSVPGTATVAEALVTDAGGNSYTFNSYGYVLDNATGVDTISVAPGTGIISGTVGGVFNLFGGDTVALGGGNNLVQSSIAGPFPQADYVAAGGGNDTITEAIGGTIAGGGGTNVLSGSSTAGSLLIISSGTNDTVNALSAGGVTVQSSGTNTTINSDSIDAGSSLYVQDTGSNTTLFGGNLGAETISAQGTNLFAVAGQGSLLFLSGAGAVSLLGASGAAESIVGGSGSILYSDLGANASVTGGSGKFIGFGGAGGTITYSSSIGGATLVALGGSETLSAAASSVGVELVGADTMFGVPQPTNDLLVGGSGSDTFIGGNGNATMTGGGGGKGDLFVFFKTATVGSATYSIGGGNTVITDFNPADTIFAAGYGSAAAAAALATATTTGGSTTVTLSDNTRITFAGVGSASTLTNHFLSA